MINKRTDTIKKILLTALSVVLVAGINQTTANATCEQKYGGGETCVVTTRFKIKKYVRLEGDNTWRDEIEVDLNDDDENDKHIEFRIDVTVEASDGEGLDLSDLKFDDLKMKDSWPEELKFLSDESDDDLTETWDDFEFGDKKTFYITGKIESDEEDREGDFEKCVVNKASLYYEDDFQASDEAVVCYKKAEGEVLGITTIAELPKTGFLPSMPLTGIVMLSFGVYLNSKQKSNLNTIK